MPVPSHPSDENGPSTTAIFLVLRRMRAPLLVLIVTFAVSIFGLTLMPGVDAEGRPWRMDPFEAFYFMSYTASTIGFGEIPYPFSTAQRLWVTISIYLTVIAWAYAIGTVFALIADQGFKTALAAQRFNRVVRLLRQPFRLVVGFGQAGELLARSLDDLDQRLVVLDLSQDRIDALALASFHNDVPGFAGDGRNPEELLRAGLASPHCAGVIALTNDDEANLAVVMTTALLRPDLPIVARAASHQIAERMREFADPQIVDPFDLFGDELLLELAAPDTARLVDWLTGDPGRPLPPQPDVPPVGRWVIAGHGRFGSRLTDDLVRQGIAVTVIDAVASPRDDVQAVIGDATDPRVIAAAQLDTAVAFAAATDNDTTNLSLIGVARRMNPELFLVARQNEPVNAPLFASLPLDAVLVPTQLVAHEIPARIGDPLLWRFVAAARTQGAPWAQSMLARLSDDCGDRRPELWQPVLTGADNPPLYDWLAGGAAQIGDLLRDPEDRDRRIAAQVLLIARADGDVIAPTDDAILHLGDRLLVAGTPAARRSLDTTLVLPTALEYTVHGRRVGTSWAWRTLVRRN